MDSVIGFPHGTDTTEAKAFMVKQTVDMGTGEIGMVINSGALIEGEYDYVRHDNHLAANHLRLGGLHFIQFPS